MKAELRERLIMWGQITSFVLMGLLGGAFIIWAARS